MSILSVGKTGLMAAQIGLSTTGHNIANANVEGYSRQMVLQGNAQPEATGGFFLGTGTTVTAIVRQYDDFLNKTLMNTQASQAEQNGYYAQISQIDNLLADSTSGLTPALQDFFKGVQDAASNPATDASRSALLSTANTLTARFRGMSERLTEIGEGVNAEITSTVSEVNSFASKIAQLNNDIAGLSADASRMPNDLLDQRDQLVRELNKLVKVNVEKGASNTLTVSVGTGQPLVIGNRSYELATQTSLTDIGRISIGYVAGDKVSPLPDASLMGGGSLGALLKFRNESLDQTKAQLGQVAAGLAAAFNAQHQLGQDRNGALGGNFFKDIEVAVGPDRRNSPLNTAEIRGVIKDAGALTTSNYDLSYDGTNLVLKRESDGAATLITPYPQTEPQVIDGIEYSITGNLVAGDHYQIRPTAEAASNIAVGLTDVGKIALAAPVTTNAPLSNTGNGKISAGVVNADFLDPANTLNGTVTLTYDTAAGGFTGFPAAQDVVVKGGDGASTTYPAGTTPIPYVDGDTFTFGGISVAVTGTPGNNDTFSITAPNDGGTKDNRNGALLAGLQTKNILNNGKTTFQSGYAAMVNTVGNKAREVQIGGLAADAAAEQASNAYQSVVGVNLDEEAAELLRYQQAYQAAGKVMQIASQLFDVLVSLGR
jgi:flagellar hook-associated protein 1